MWERKTLSMDMSQEGGMPSKGRSTAEKVEVLRMWRREPCHKRLQQLLEVEGMRTEDGTERAEGEACKRGKSGECYKSPL